MCNPLSLVTGEEMRAIATKINDCADEPLQVEVPYLLREWDDKKQNIFDTVFNGESLIMSRNVVFQRNVDQIISEIDHNWNDMSERAREFWRAFDTLCSNKRREIYDKRGNVPPWAYELTAEEMEIENAWYKCESLCSNHVLAANAFDKDVTIDLPKPDGTIRKYHIQKGSKPMRVLGRLLRAFHFTDEENYKEFCNWHSSILNDKRIAGEFCLSIHPLDYITMSENNCGWSSCMNWPEDGCYKGGTIEMMNSPMVIVAYMKSHNDYLDMSLGWNSEKRETEWLHWNSKKWRTLIVVDKSGIYSVKSYPYYHKEMTEYAMEWIASCLTERSFKAPIKFEPYSNEKVDGMFVCVNPRTFRMYNDFGAATHFVMFDQDYLDLLKLDDSGNYHTIYFNYSGASECMSCGGLAYDDRSNGIYFDSEGQLICTSCGGCYNSEVYCEECGASWDEDDMMWVDDRLLCPDCVNENCFEDAWTYEYHLNGNGAILFIKLKNGEKDEVGMCYIDNIYSWVVDSDKEYIKKQLENCDGKVTIKLEDLNRRGRSNYDRMTERRARCVWTF